MKGSYGDRKLKIRKFSKYVISFYFKNKFQNDQKFNFYVVDKANNFIT